MIVINNATSLDYDGEYVYIQVGNEIVQISHDVMQQIVAMLGEGED